MEQTFNKRYDTLKEQIVNLLISEAQERTNGTIIMPKAVELDYVSDDNGWCFDTLGAFNKNGEAFFVEEDSELSGRYDFEEDEDGVVVACMSLSDIFLHGLVLIAKELGLACPVIATADALLAEIDERINNIGDTVPVNIPLIVYADKDMFWRTTRVKGVSSKELDTPVGKISMDNIAIDDKCHILDFLTAKLKNDEKE